MLLRWLLTSLMHGAARDQLRDIVATAGQQLAGGVDPANQQPLPPADVAIVFAMGIEQGGFEDRLSNVACMKAAGFTVRHGLLAERPVLAIETGAGAAAAGHAISAAISAHRPRWVVSAGFSGGLQPQLKFGDIVMANSLVNADDQRLAVDFSISQQAIEATRGLHVGRLLMANQVILRREEKERLGQQFDALAVDLESYAVAEVCQREKVRFLAVRVISDTVTDELPPEVERLIAPQSATRRVGAAMGAIWNRPSSVKDMLKLREDALVASDRLAKFLAGVIPQLR